jgi:hypothetical protein
MTFFPMGLARWLMLASASFLPGFDASVIAQTEAPMAANGFLVTIVPELKRHPDMIVTLNAAPRFAPGSIERSSSYHQNSTAPIPLPDPPSRPATLHMQPDDLGDIAVKSHVTIFKIFQ